MRDEKCGEIFTLETRNRESEWIVGITHTHTLTYIYKSTHTRILCKGSGERLVRIKLSFTIYNSNVCVCMLGVSQSKWIQRKQQEPGRRVRSHLKRYKDVRSMRIRHNRKSKSIENNISIYLNEWMSYCTYRYHYYYY